MDLGYVKFIKPKEEKLLPLIKGYYIHQATAPDFYSKITFYQNITTCISIYNDSFTSSSGRLRQQHYSPHSGFNAVLVGLVDKYQEVEFHGPLDRVSIVFYSCGLNQFVDTPLGSLLKKHYSSFDLKAFDFLPTIESVFAQDDLEAKRDLLDQFFMRRWHPFPDKVLLSAVDHILNEGPTIRVEELARKNGISRRTLLRKFRKHLGYSMEEYLSVIKFRNALFHFFIERQDPNLSNIAYSSNYYDQADFNHNLKHRSGLTPKQLFAELEIVDDVLFWRL